jgi:excinuclease ABC subunit C
MVETPPHIAEKLSRLPNKPGVYQYYDAEGSLLYVGKAKDLKNRVSSYFNKNRYENAKTKLLVRKIYDIKIIVVDTELDALLLENSLIKKHQPKYNIQLKDDKTYPWIVIKKERFPRVFPTRNVIKDGSEYFGPYASVRMMKALLDLIKQLYPLRNCTYVLSEQNIDAGKFRVCLEYHMGNCLGPCEGKMSEQDYLANIQSIRQIIKGNISDLIREMKDLMHHFASHYRFEEAHAMKSRLEVLLKYQAKSTIVNPAIHNVDVFSIATDSSGGYVNYIKVNNGAIIHSHTIELRKKLDESVQELLAYAIVELRERYHSVSSEVYIPFEIELELPGVLFHVPQRGDKKKLVELSERNAVHYMRDRQKQTEAIDPEAAQIRILTALQKDLHLQDLPVHIECFDNSNIQGSNPASACVVFKNGKPSKKDYRTFNVKTVIGPNDFASMHEVIGRRYGRLLDEGQSLPQLVIIDGGKGQLSAAMEAVQELGLRGKVAVIGIAKRLEEIYFPGDSLPVYIDKKSESLRLIQHLRNEAHRFSLGHHRNRRSKAAIQSELTEIPGIGAKTAETLVKEFGSVAKVKQASQQELEKVLGKNTAHKVATFFREADSK